MLCAGRHRNSQRVPLRLSRRLSASLGVSLHPTRRAAAAGRRRHHHCARRRFAVALQWLMILLLTSSTSASVLMAEKRRPWPLLFFFSREKRLEISGWLVIDGPFFFGGGGFSFEARPGVYFFLASCSAVGVCEIAAETSANTRRNETKDETKTNESRSSTVAAGFRIFFSALSLSLRRIFGSFFFLSLSFFLVRVDRPS